MGFLLLTHASWTNKENFKNANIPMRWEEECAHFILIVKGKIN